MSDHDPQDLPIHLEPVLEMQDGQGRAAVHLVVMPTDCAILEPGV